jgi:hypothetical protein
MNKVKILTVSFLIATSLSSLGVAQQAGGGVASNDVAGQLYKLNQGIIKQQGVLEARHQDLVEAISEYYKNPSEQKAFLTELQKDVDAAQQYSALVAQANTQIAKAEATFYEETPATQAEIETGPTGKGVPAGGESVASEIPLPPAMVVSKLKTEIKNNGGIKGDFAAQLTAQKQKLKEVQQRIQAEASDPAVKADPVAQKQNSDLQSALSRAIDARRKALGEDQ